MQWRGVEGLAQVLGHVLQPGDPPRIRQVWHGRAVASDGLGHERQGLLIGRKKDQERFLQEALAVQEPRHGKQKLRRKPDTDAKARIWFTSKARQVESLRPLVGFVTSGGFSYRHGRGLGVAVAARASRDLPWLWARNTTSPQYFPVWLQSLPDDQGCG